jgi:hypothetical protein
MLFSQELAVSQKFAALYRTKASESQRLVAKLQGQIEVLLSHSFAMTHGASLFGLDVIWTVESF